MNNASRIKLCLVASLWLFWGSTTALWALTVGNRVQVTSVTNIRSCAGTGCSILAEGPVGAKGVIAGGPTSANGFTWWQVDWDGSLPTGWSIDSNLGLAVPLVSGVSPTSMTADGASHTLSVNGSNFSSVNRVQFKWGVGTGSGVWTTGNAPSVGSASQMTISMNPGTVNDTIFVRVCRSLSQTSTSDCSSGTQSVTVTATIPQPSVSSVSPTSMTADGASHTLTVSGSNFSSVNRVQFKWGVGAGSGVWTTGNAPSVSSASQMTISMNPGTVNDTIFVRVCRSSSQTSTSDCSSGTQSVTVTATIPLPSVSSISPTAMTADGASHTLTINGSNFSSVNRVQFKWGVGAGSGVWTTGNAPSVGGASQMTISMNPGTVNDTIFVRVCRSSSQTSTSDCSSGTQSVTVTATIPLPSVSSISPTAMTADGASHTLTVNGSNFSSVNRVQFKWGSGAGSGVWTTGNAPSVGSSSQMTISMNPGTVNDTIFVRVCRSSSQTSTSDCSSGTQSVTVTATIPQPSVSSVSPTSMTADGASHTLTINGSNFSSVNQVQFKWGVGAGSGVWTTGSGNPPSVVSASQMTISMNPGTVNDTIFVRVCRSSSQTSTSDCSSGTQSVTVTTTAPVPSVTSVSPTSMTADGALHTLTINGSNFQSSNRVQFKWGVGTGSGVWTTGNGNPPSVVSASQMTIGINPGTVNDTIFVRVCRSSSQASTSDCSSGTQSVAVTTTAPVPSVTSVSPTSMTADGALHTLTINGSNFSSVNRVQFKWGAGAGFGVWTTGSGNPPSVSSSTLMTINMNPGTVEDTILVRVCRSSSQTNASDCSSVAQSVTVFTTTAVPTVNSVNPTSVTANVLDTLIIDGNNFRVGNGVQFRWTVGPGAGLWKESNHPPYISSANRMTVRMNPGSVADTISVRVCRFIGATSTQDCSSTYEVTVTPQTAAPPRWLALGDSYSSGEGADAYAEDSNYQICSVPPSDDSTCPMLVENRCHRSSRAYSQVVDNNSGLGFPNLRAEVFHACSGAVTSNVLPSAAGGFAQPYGDPDNIPQLDHLDAGGEDVDMVTLTIGGNDAKFADILKTCLFNDTFFNCADSDYVWFGPTWREFMPNWIRVDVRYQVRKTLRQVCARSPQATIYLLGYPKLFPTQSHFCSFYPGSLTADEQTWLNGIAFELNKMLREEAERSHVQFVDVESTFHGHELCGAGDEFFNGVVLLDPDESFHPNPSGQSAGYRKALVNHLSLNPPHEEGATACDSTPFPLDSAELASNGDDAALAAMEGDTATLGSIQVASPLLCRRNGLAFDRQLSTRAEGFLPGSPVSFRLLSPAGVTDLGSATADANGLVQAELAVPQPAAISELAVLEANGTGSNGLFRKVLGSFAIGPAASTDGDLDGTSDACDNCPELWNADQADADGDGVGDDCDSCPLASGNDSDGDGLCDNSDSCPYDSENDADGDGLCGNGADNCPVAYNPGQEDADGDLVGDACDNCPMISNLGQEDVCGLFPVAAPLDFYTLLPCRAVDTRPSQSPLLSGTVRAFQLAGMCGIPAAAGAVAVNVTAVNATQGGYVTLFPADQAVPGTTVLNFQAGQVRANNAILKLSADGRIAVIPGLAAAGQVDLVIDVNGYFDAGNPEPPTFAPKVDQPTGPEPVGLAVADFDGDQRPDIAVSIYNHGHGDHLSILRNIGTTGNLDFDTPLDIPTGSGPEGLAAGDLNNDGKIDLVTANADSVNVSMLRNASTPGFIDFQPVPALSIVGTPHRVVIADFDGDGRPDLIVTSNSGRRVAVFHHASDPNTIAFDYRRDYGADGYLNDLAVTDIDRDTRPDILIPITDTGLLTIFQNNSSPGNVQAGALPSLTAGAPPIRGVAVGDLNNDLAVDVVVAAIGGVGIFRNSSSPGVFDLPRTDLPTGTNPDAVAIGDLNNDGLLDVAVANPSGNTVTVLHNTSEGSPIELTPLDPALATGLTPFTLVLGDVDGDGWLDMVVANADGNSVSVILNTSGQQ